MKYSARRLGVKVGVDSYWSLAMAVGVHSLGVPGDHRQPHAVAQASISSSHASGRCPVAQHFASHLGVLTAPAAVRQIDRDLGQVVQAHAGGVQLRLHVGPCEPALAAKIHRWAGVIRSYRAQRSDDPKAGIGVRAFVLVRLTRTPTPDIIRRINALAGTRRCYSVAGETDLVVEVAVPEMAGLNEQRDTMASLDGVAGVTTMPVLRVERE